LDQEWLVYNQLPAGGVLPTLVTTNWQDGSSNSFNVARSQAFFSLQAGGSGVGVYLAYRAIPEPGTLALAGIGLAAALPMPCAGLPGGRESHAAWLWQRALRHGRCRFMPPPKPGRRNGRPANCWCSKIAGPG
jgi:hypothetical protein